MAILKYLLHATKSLALLPLLFLTSCSSYHLGSPGLSSLPFQTLYVRPVINKSFVPQAQALLSEQIIRHLQQSGIKITQCEREADASLIVVIEKYDHSVLSTRRHDTTLASSFSVLLAANATLINNQTGVPFFEDVKATATFSAEANDSVQRVLYQDMPILTQKLANQIRNLVIGTW